MARWFLSIVFFRLFQLKIINPGVLSVSWWEQGLRLLLAVLVGCVIGIERERKNRPAGMRTHVLVCVGAATIAMHGEHT